MLRSRGRRCTTTTLAVLAWAVPAAVQRRAAPNGSGCRRCPSTSPESRRTCSRGLAARTRSSRCSRGPRPPTTRTGRRREAEAGQRPAAVAKQQRDAVAGRAAARRRGRAGRRPRRQRPHRERAAHPAVRLGGRQAAGGADPRHAGAARRRRRRSTPARGQRLDPAGRRDRPRRQRGVDDHRRTIGDGPHGSAGDGTGDFDFYAIRGAEAGQRLIVDIDTPDRQPRLRSSCSGTPPATRSRRTTTPTALDSLLSRAAGRRRLLRHGRRLPQPAGGPVRLRQR